MQIVKYHIRSQEKEKKHFLEVFWEEKKTKRTLLKESNKEELTLLQYLLEKAPWDVPLSSVELSSSKAAKGIKLLGACRRLYWNEQKVFFDPFSSPEIFYEVKPREEGNFLVLGKWQLKTSVGNLGDFGFLFPSQPSFGVIRGTLQFLEGDFQFRECAMKLPELEEFLKECARDGVRVEGVTSLCLEETLSCTPVLMLRDRKGAFADLYFDYAGTLVSYHDMKKNSKRNTKLEKDWEKDLLETDFKFHFQEKSHYYCSLDKVAKSLTFLLEIGWKILDHTGKSVLKMKEQSLSLTERPEGILVQGALSYEDHRVDLQGVVGAFNRQEQFVLLDSGHVGILDLSEDVEEICGELIVAEGVLVKKQHVGLLSAFLDQKGCSAYQKLVLKEGGAFCESPPSSAFRGTLFPYQQQGVNFLAFLKSWGCSGLLADEMGLGKTVQVLAFFSQIIGPKPLLIVVPTSLLFNWKREIEAFLPLATCLMYSGPKRSLEGIGKGSLILTSYAVARTDIFLLKALDYGCIVLDEGQTIKNPDSQISQSLFQLNSEMRVILTGTPIENRWEDVWSLYHFLMPGLLGDRKEFNAKMLAANLDGRYLKQLKKKIRPFILRRLKEEVALDLPEKILQTVFIEMESSQRELYESWVKKNKTGVLKKIAADGAGAHRMEVLEAILRLRQLCAHPCLVERGETQLESAKYQRLFDDLKEVIESGRKVLVYSQFTEMLKLIEKGVIERSYGYVYLDGSTQEREQVVQKFQEDPGVQVFLISLKAGGVGLNLTAADYVFLYDPWWNDAAENQAIDRAHRIGRKGTVVARRYIMAESIEEKILHLKKHKTSLAEGLLSLDEIAFSELTINDLSALLE